VRRILLLITDLEIGGTPTVVRELATRLRRPPEVEMEVACLSRWGPVADQLREAAVNVTALEARGARDLIRTTRRLTALVRERGYDTVLSFLVHANAIAAIASRFCGEQVRWLQSIQTTQPSPRWHWWVQGLVQAAAERVIVPSPSAAQVARDWAGVPDEKIVVIPNAVDVEALGRIAAQPPGVRSPITRVGFLGRLDPVKRVDVLIRAVRLLGGGAYELHVFGDGAERRGLELLARSELAGRVRFEFHGAVPSPGEALKQIDVLVLPSDAEGFGLVLIEAMAAGVPVVATEVAGIRDVVQDGCTGLLVRAGDAQELAGAIRRVSEDDALRERLVREGLGDVRERYSWSAVLEKYRELVAAEAVSPLGAD
jgi:glycosyltransferase involved in cell wall biosynthesis